MCECEKVHMYEVDFKLDGMVVVPTHKNCGEALNEKQVDKFQKELVKTWGIKDEDEKKWLAEIFKKEKKKGFPKSIWMRPLDLYKRSLCKYN